MVNGTAYYYRISAVNSGGETLSLEVNARPHITSILYNSSLFGILQESINVGSDTAASSVAFKITKSSVDQASGIEAAASANFKNQSGLWH